MSAFSIWALSIIGIVMLGMLIDTIMPEGQTSKYIKSVFAIVTVFVIVSPIPKILKGDYDLSEIFGESMSFEIDGEFIESINRQKVAALSSAAETALTAAGYVNVDFSVIHETKDSALVITRIFVDTGNAEYNGQALNTNSTNGIKDILCNIFGVKQEVISLYG